MLTLKPLEKEPFFPATSCYTASIFYAYNSICTQNSINDFLFFIGNSIPSYRELNTEFFISNGITPYAYSPLFFSYKDDYGNMIHDYRHNKEIYLYRISKYFKTWFNIDVIVNDYYIHSSKLLNFIKQNIRQKKFVIINLNEFYNKCSPLYNSPKLKEGVAHCLLIINQNDYGVEVIDSRCFLNSYFVPNEILIESYEKNVKSFNKLVLISSKDFQNKIVYQEFLPIVFANLRKESFVEKIIIHIKEIQNNKPQYLPYVLEGIVNSINRFMLLPDLSISHIVMRVMEHAKIKNEIIEETILLKDAQFLRGKKLTSLLLNRLSSNKTKITNSELKQFYTELSEIAISNNKIAKTLLENENYLYKVAQS
ncbi:hypothetical protein [Treponema lecithinolyticum]